MRNIAHSINDAFDKGAIRLCNIMIITLKNEQRLGFSDHDQAFIFHDLVVKPEQALRIGVSQTDTGDTTGFETSIMGSLTSECITSEDIHLGLYDRARIDFYTAQWTHASPQDTFETRKGIIIASVHLNTAYITQIDVNVDETKNNASFVAHIEGASHRLDTVIGRTYSRLCDARLGDQRCALTLTQINNQTCDKRYETCRDRFSNAVNFQGFPDIIGEDAVMFYPRLGDVMNGQSRGRLT